MRYKFITVSALDPSQGEEELNAFLAQHRIVSLEKTLVQADSNPTWSFVIAYDGPHSVSSGKRAAVDYKEVLDAEDFQRFAQLRELRNRRAKEEGVPAYTIFTNEQLAALVTESVTSPAQMAKISGIGTARIERYSEIFLPLLQEMFS